MRSLYLSGALSIALGACESEPAAVPRDVLVADVVDATADVVTGDANTLDASSNPDVAADAPVDRPVAPDVTRTMTEAQMTERRRACAFNAGSFPVETLGQELPLDGRIPIDHVLVVMMENRSFDHYFSQLRARGVTNVDVPAEDWSNPRADSTPVRRYHETQPCVRDTNHEWNGSFAQWNNGRNDGFVTTNDPNGERAMGYFDEADIPFYYGLARSFAIGDRYFSSVMGPTWPNRFYMIAASSFGRTTNTPYDETAERPGMHIFRLLESAGLEWRDYAGDLRVTAIFPWFGIVRRQTRDHYRSHDDLMSDLRAGTLPPFSFIEPHYAGDGGAREDEHPPGTPMAGERFVERIVRALMASPAWNRSALFITYDEHGGFADHVPPPDACPPDGLMPVDASGAPRPRGTFQRYGFRVPFMVVSPYARRGFVSHTVYDHASILRFVEARFGLPAMTARDANANVPLDMFDFASAPNRTPPTLPPGGYNTAVQDRCRMMFPSATGGE